MSDDDRADGVETAHEPDEDVPILFLHGVERHYRQGDATLRHPQRRRAGASGRASRWRWSRRPAPANRRCCTSPACSSIPMPARSMSTGAPTCDPVRRRAHPHPPHRDRLRLPVPSSAAGILRAGERMLPQMIRGLSRAEAQPSARPSC